MSFACFGVRRLDTIQSRLSSEEALRRFQAGELPEADQQWHRLVPLEAREALGKQEVQRQSVMFEVVTSEKEYVADLEAVKEVSFLLCKQAPLSNVLYFLRFSSIRSSMHHHL